MYAVSVSSAPLPSYISYAFPNLKTVIHSVLAGDIPLETESPLRVELPDPFMCDDGTRVTDPDQWPQRRREMLRTIVDTEYGGLPPTPAGVRGERLSTNRMARILDAQYSQYRISLEDHPAFHIRLDLVVPPGKGPFPVILNGDGCWRTLTDEILLAIMRRGFISAQFSRVEVVPDIALPERNSGLYAIYPDARFGALAAWAWGYHRCIDFLTTLEIVDTHAIAVTGHSRGGKAALLAGATDERVALTAPNGSGCGGAGCYRWQGPKSETMAIIRGPFEFWFGPDLWQWIGREQEMPFDQHFLKAACAPRAMLSTEGLGDLWANPEGTWQTYLAAREVFRFLGVEHNIGIHFREGGHQHGIADWTALLDFAQWKFRGYPLPYRFDTSPFTHLPKAFSWSCPAT